MDPKGRIRTEGSCSLSGLASGVKVFLKRLQPEPVETDSRFGLMHPSPPRETADLVDLLQGKVLSQPDALAR